MDDGLVERMRRAMIETQISKAPGDPRVRKNTHWRAWWDSGQLREFNEETRPFAAHVRVEYARLQRLDREIAKKTRILHSVRERAPSPVVEGYLSELAVLEADRAIKCEEIQRLVSRPEVVDEAFVRSLTCYMHMAHVDMDM